MTAAGPEIPKFRRGTVSVPDASIIASLVLVALIYLTLSMDRAVGVFDEALILLGATRVLDGAIPHRDFYTLYGPGQFYAVAALSKSLACPFWWSGPGTRSRLLFRRDGVHHCRPGGPAPVCHPRRNRKSCVSRILRFIRLSGISCARGGVDRFRSPAAVSRANAGFLEADRGRRVCRQQPRCSATTSGSPPSQRSARCWPSASGPSP